MCQAVLSIGNLGTVKHISDDLILLKNDIDMEVSKRKPFPICRPGQPPPPPPPRSSPPVSADLPASRQVPLRRAPPPPPARALSVPSHSKQFLPTAPETYLMNGNHSLTRCNPEAPKTAPPQTSKRPSAPISIVRPYNFQPPTRREHLESEEPSHGHLVKSTPTPVSENPVMAHSYSSRSSSPSFLEELQRTFPLLKPGSKIDTNLVKPSQNTCDKENLSKPNEDLEKSEEGLKVTTSVTSGDSSIHPSSNPPNLTTIAKNKTLVAENKQPLARDLYRPASLPVMSTQSAGSRPAISGKPAHLTCLTTPPNLPGASSQQARHLLVRKSSKQHAAPLRPSLMSSSLRDLTREREEVHIFTPSLPPRLDKLLPSMPPPPQPPKRRESLLRKVKCAFQHFIPSSPISRCPNVKKVPLRRDSSRSLNQSRIFQTQGQ